MRTKIIATVGPTSSEKDVLEQLVDAGVSIFRLNFSHGNKAFFKQVISHIRAIEKEKLVALTVMQDLSGPKIRIGMIEEGQISVGLGDLLLLGKKTALKEKYPLIPFDNDVFMESLTVQDVLIFADGGLELKVIEIRDDGLVVLESLGFGIITSRKGLVLPGKAIRIAALTEKDKQDLALGVELGVNAVAMSFVQEAQDIRELKELLKEYNVNIPVVAKLERQGAIDNLDAILAETDMVMVARGDLGVECPLALLPSLQKKIIQSCNALAKPVIVATQMLLSMVNHTAPTRAEVTDVANAVLDGADCLMLSEETAMGNYPVETVRYMRQITNNAENLLIEQRDLRRPEEGRGKAEFLAYSACLLAEKVNASALIAHSTSGRSALLLATCRPKQKVYAITPRQEVIYALNFAWGIYPHLVEESVHESHVKRVEDFIYSHPEFDFGVEYILTAGDHPEHEQSNGTNVVKIYKK